jgi:hypothetical protein
MTMPPRQGSFRERDELRLIHRLERLARDWPDGYMLASMGGTLCLFRTDDRGADGPGVGLDAEKALWDTGAIPNTGGDW